MNAYITNSNSKSIIYDLDVSEFDINEQIFRIRITWFSKFEKQSLLAFKMLFENPTEFFKIYKKRVPIDTKKYVFEGQAPAYHLSENCDRILSSFHNYKIPDYIKKQGPEKIDEFRFWFKEHLDLLENKPDVFLERIRLRFGLKQKPEVVDYKNSGVEIIENLNLEELDERIEKLIIEAREFIKSDNQKLVILSNFAKYSFIHKERKKPNFNDTGYSNEEIWSVLKEFDEKYKNPIIFLLREYYKIKFNPDLAFEGELLEQLGFKPCVQCAKKKSNLVSKILPKNYDIIGLYTDESNDLKLYLSENNTFSIEDMYYPSLTTFMAGMDLETQNALIESGENPLACKMEGIGTWKKEDDKIIFDIDLFNSDDNFQYMDFAVIQNGNLKYGGQLLTKRK